MSPTKYKIKATTTPSRQCKKELRISVRRNVEMGIYYVRLETTSQLYFKGGLKDAPFTQSIRHALVRN